MKWLKTHFLLRTLLRVSSRLVSVLEERRGVLQSLLLGRHLRFSVAK
jgi:hypothetical protein